VNITYERAGELKTIRTRAVALCCPKFIARRLLPSIEPERDAAISQLNYRAYVVANVLLHARTARPFYDLFLLNSVGERPSIRERADAVGVTDVVLGNLHQLDGERSVLTLYRAYPYDGGRLELFAPNAFDTIRAALEEQVIRDILPLLGYRPDHVQEIRVTRWGHPLPVAKIGLLRGGVPEKLRAPIDNRIFFVEQDNWALPAFETALGEALHFAPLIEEQLYD